MNEKGLLVTYTLLVTASGGRGTSIRSPLLRGDIDDKNND